MLQEFRWYFQAVRRLPLGRRSMWLHGFQTVWAIAGTECSLRYSFKLGHASSLLAPPCFPETSDCKALLQMTTPCNSAGHKLVLMRPPYSHRYARRRDDHLERFLGCRMLDRRLLQKKKLRSRKTQRGSHSPLAARSNRALGLQFQFCASQASSDFQRLC